MSSMKLEAMWVAREIKRGQADVLEGFKGQPRAWGSGDAKMGIVGMRAAVGSPV